MSNTSSSDAATDLAPNFIPKDRLAGLKENWRSDIVSGFTSSFLSPYLSVSLSKEVPILLGVPSPSKEPLVIFSKVPDMLMHLNPEIAQIGASPITLSSFLF